MDPESYLNLLSPSFTELDAAWGSPSESNPYSMHTSTALAWLADGFINTEAAEDEEEDDEEESEEAGVSKSPSSAPTFPFNGRGLSNSSETYSSVLKLSDIASALHTFSCKAAGMSGAHKPAPALRKSSSVGSFYSGPQSSSLPDSSSPMQSASALKNFNLNAPQVQFRAFDARNRARDVSSGGLHPHIRVAEVASKAGTDMQVSEEVSNKLQRSDSIAADEGELLSSKLTHEGGSCWGFSENEISSGNDDEDDDSVTYEDVKPCVSHVRIIRRPNSNCGQKMSPSPKRAKLAPAMAEATSSSEMAGMLDDKDGASSLKQMRKEGMSQREVHILSERQRRKSMRESFSILQSLIPKLKLKHTDRITVLTEVITYIQSLRGTLEELERRKADMMEFLGISAKSKSRRQCDDLEGTVTYVHSNNSGSSDEKGESLGGWCSLKNGELVAMVEVTVRMCGPDVFLTLNVPQRRGVWSGVLSLLQKFGIDVSNATLATSGDSSFHCIHAKATNMARVEGVDLQEELEGVIVKELRRRIRKGRNQV